MTPTGGVDSAAMWTVDGDLNGRQYSLTWSDGAIIDAPPFLVEWLALHEGQWFGLTPTGPFLPLDPKNGDSIFAALRDSTHVEDWKGDIPEFPALLDGEIG